VKRREGRNRKRVKTEKGEMGKTKREQKNTREREKWERE
jgi:hypothetical protein